MPVRDLYHDLVRRLLERDGWSITHDPFVLRFGQRAAFVDLAALGGERDGKKIAIEVKGPNVTQLAELEKAIGQFVIYRSLLSGHDRERTLYLAIPRIAFRQLSEVREFQVLQRQIDLKLLVFDTDAEVITQWMD